MNKLKKVLNRKQTADISAKEMQKIVEYDILKRKSVL